MFKSKARKEAERQLKVEQEKQRLLEEKQRKLERQKQVEAELEQLAVQAGVIFRKVSRWFLALSLRNKAIVSAGSLGLVLVLSQCSSSVTSSSEPSVTQTTTSAPEAIASPSQSPTPSTAPSSEEIAQIAYSEACFERVDQAYGFDSPKGAVIGAYISAGYTRQEIDSLDLWGLTRIAAMKIDELDGNEAAAASYMASSYFDNVELAGTIVTAVAEEVYMPRHQELAVEKCANLVQ